MKKLFQVGISLYRGGGQFLSSNKPLGDININLCQSLAKFVMLFFVGDSLSLHLFSISVSHVFRCLAVRWRAHWLLSVGILRDLFGIGFILRVSYVHFWQWLRTAKTRGAGCSVKLYSPPSTVSVLLSSEPYTHTNVSPCILPCALLTANQQCMPFAGNSDLVFPIRILCEIYS